MFFISLYCPQLYFFPPATAAPASVSGETNSYILLYILLVALPLLRCPSSTVHNPGPYGRMRPSIMKFAAVHL